jgi:ABC-type Na+ transport system ATPase subunit NatA
MRTFRAIFSYESRRFLCKKNIAVFLLFLVLSLYLVQDGISQYNSIIENKARFQEIEEVKVSQYINYTQYGLYGIRLLFIPSPLSIFFTNSSLISGLTANIDSSDVLRIYNSFKGKNLYSEKIGGYKDFAGIILLFGTLLVLYFGHDSFRYKGYIKFLSGLSDYRRVFAFIQVSRVLLLMLFFTLLTVLALLLLAINGILLKSSDVYYLLYFLGVWFLVMIFLFMLGVITGTAKSRFNGIAMLLVFWFAFVFFIPGVINTLTSKRADDITSNYQLEFEKLKVLMDFEKRALDQAKRYTSMKERVTSERKLVESSLTNEIKRIQDLEEKMKQEMMDSFYFFRNLSVVFPTTFYQSVSNEVGSRGYENFFSFYQYIQCLKDGFVRYYIKKKFYSNYDKVESFIRGDQNLYYAASRLPGNFWWGILITLLYIALLTTGSYRRFKSFLFHIPDKKMPELKKLDVELKSGQSEVVLTGEQTLKNQFYNVLSGEVRGFDGKLMLDDVNMAGDRKRVKDTFLFLCRPEEIPEDIRAGNLIHLFQDLMMLSKKEKAKLYLELNMEPIEKKYFGDLEDADKGKLLMAAARLKKCKVYMIDDFARGMPPDFILRLIGELRELKANGSSILYLTTDTLIVKKVGDSVSSLFDDPGLHKHLKTFRSLNDEPEDMLITG